MAHNFNNFLTAIRGYADLMAERLRASSSLDEGGLKSLRQDLEEIRRAGERASGLTAQLLAFSRKQVLEKRVLDLNRQVEQAERMLKRIVGEDVLLETELSSGLDHVEADAGQLEQAIVNLAVNARDAMPSGGVLRISTRNRVLREVVPTDHGEIPPGPYVVMSAADTGS